MNLATAPIRITVVFLSIILSYLLVIVFGHLRDLIGKRFAKSSFTHLMPYDVRLLCRPVRRPLLISVRDTHR